MQKKMFKAIMQPFKNLFEIMGVQYPRRGTSFSDSTVLHKGIYVASTYFCVAWNQYSL
jgi:hypothetical protein